MKIKIESIEGGEIRAFVEDVPGLEVPVVVDAYYEEDDTQFIEGRAVAHSPEGLSIERVRVYVGEVGGLDYHVDIHLDYSQKQKIIEGLWKLKGAA